MRISAMRTAKFEALVLLMTCVGVMVSVSGAGDGRKGVMVGSWSPIKDPNNLEVRSVGEFAVTEHNKQANTGLKFEKVVRGKTQVVAGLNYKLVVAAKDGDVSNKYEAVVWVKAWENFMNLTSFKRV